MTWSECARRSTIHPLDLSLRARSPCARFLWSCVTVVAFVLAIAHIGFIVHRYRMGGWTVLKGHLTADEAFFPNASLCFDHWALWIDFGRASQEFGLEKTELVSLLAPFSNKLQLDQCGFGAPALWRAVSKLGLTNNSDDQTTMMTHDLLDICQRLFRAKSGRIGVLKGHPHLSLRRSPRSEGLMMCVEARIDLKRQPQPIGVQFDLGFDRSSLQMYFSETEIEQIDRALDGTTLVFYQI